MGDREEVAGFGQVAETKKIISESIFTLYDVTNIIVKLLPNKEQSSSYLKNNNPDEEEIGWKLLPVPCPFAPDPLRDIKSALLFRKGLVAVEEVVEGQDQVAQELCLSKYNNYSLAAPEISELLGLEYLRDLRQGLHALIEAYPT